MAFIVPNPDTNPKHKGPWYVRWRIAGLLQRSEALYSLLQARDLKARKEVEELEDKKFRRGVTHEEANPLKILESYLLSESREGHLRESTVMMKRRILTPFLSRFSSIGQLTDAVIEKWKEEMLQNPTGRSLAKAQLLGEPTAATPYSPTTASIHMRTLHSVLRWCVRKKIIRTDPMAGMKIPKSKRRRDIAKSRADIEGLIAAAPTQKFRLFLTFLFYQGLRKGMVMQAEGSEIQDGMWTIPGYKAKVDRDITVPLHPKTLAALDETFPNGIPNGYIFKGFHDNVNSIRDMWIKSKLQAGISYPLTIHGARRTWATSFLGHTQNLKAMMEAGHWRDVNTAMGYVHIAAKWLQRDVNTFEYKDFKEENK